MDSIYTWSKIMLKSTKTWINLSIKGMWHRPFEKNLDEVIATLKNVKALHMNQLFIETFFNGQLIYPSHVSMTMPHAFVGSYGIYGKNLLKAFINEAKAFDIKIHAWVENFFVGVYNDPYQSQLFQLKPSWFMQNIDGTYLQKNEVNYLFLDPSSTEVRDYLKNLYKEMITYSNLESLHLDYIRYPVTYRGDDENQSDDTGHSKSAIEQFEIAYNVNLNNDRYQLIGSQLYELWCQFKANQINQFVREVYLHTCDKVKISTAVFGDPQHAKKIKMQDWLTWVNHGYIDLIIPMAYYKSDERVFDEITKMKKLINHKAICVAGLAPIYIGESLENQHLQLVAVANAELDGFVLFASQNYLSKHFNGTLEHGEEMISFFSE